MKGVFQVPASTESQKTRFKQSQNCKVGSANCKNDWFLKRFFAKPLIQGHRQGSKQTPPNSKTLQTCQKRPLKAKSR